MDLKDHYYRLCDKCFYDLSMPSDIVIKRMSSPYYLGRNVDGNGPILINECVDNVVPVLAHEMIHFEVLEHGKQFLNLASIIMDRGCDVHLTDTHKARMIYS